MAGEAQPFPEATGGSQLSMPMQHLLHAMLYGGKCLGYQNLPFTDAVAVALTIPANAKIALIVVERVGAVADENKIARFREDGADPTAANGMPLGNNGSVEIKGTQNLAAFKIIGIDAGISHVAHIQYYGQG